MASLEQKYRPTRLSEVVLPDAEAERAIRPFLLSSPPIAHVLLYGPNGVGKSTIAELLPEAVAPGCEPQDVLRLNGKSDDCAPATLRAQVFNFISTFSLNQRNVKFVILNEVDGLHQNCQETLRGLMDRFPGSVMMILTTNQIAKIEPGIRDRCHEIYIGPIPPYALLKRAREICVSEGKAIPNGILTNVAQRSFGSFRALLRQLAAEF
jgi:DNA polymerase III delta prime subunit